MYGERERANKDKCKPETQNPDACAGITKKTTQTSSKQMMQEWPAPLRVQGRQQTRTSMHDEANYEY